MNKTQTTPAPVQLTRSAVSAELNPTKLVLREVFADCRRTELWNQPQTMKLFKDGTDPSCFALNTYKFLLDHVEVTDETERLTKELTEYLKSVTTEVGSGHFFRAEYDYTDIEQWAQQVGTDPELNEVYTYGWDSNVLSDDILFCHFELDGKDYITFRLHFGNDARCGFTEPVVFQVNGDYDFFSSDILAPLEYYVADENVVYICRAGDGVEKYVYETQDTESVDEVPEFVEVNGEYFTHIGGSKVFIEYNTDH